MLVEKTFFRIVANLIFAVALVSAVSASAASSAPQKTSESAALMSSELKGLLSICSKDWAEYQAELARSRMPFEKKIKSLSQKEFDASWGKSEPFLRYISLHWPSMVAEKNQFWQIYQGCAEVNLDVRKALDSAGASSQQKKELVNRFRACVRGLFAPRGEIPFPFDQLLSCYDHHAR